MGFDSTWLDLRAPADDAARNAGLAERFAAAVGPGARIVDLGSGTGSTARALSPLLPDARWTLSDNDPVLLAEAARRFPAAACIQADLASDLETVLSDDCTAITASALFDLVSEDWIARFARAVEKRVVYAALTYDGKKEWVPAHAADATIASAFRRHQRRDKGFGPASGHDAADVLADALTARGYDVSLAPSPWRLSRETEGALMTSLADGVAGAAVEAGCDPAVAEEWRCARHAAQRCTVGHVDLLAIPR